ncbi:hypothetical protein [Acinetobacter sp. SA01]|uniref:hypothetical protein n=1 Tax=Acinetobacter sp. SA01 TaxID=1862567 RepID=UPI00140C4F64|nr:hypothetical protein [Acinetobacter sp. SA01]
MEVKQLEPMDVIRSEMGTWTHPVYSAYMGENLGNKEYISPGEWEDFKRHFNIDTVTFWMESSINYDDWEAMMDDCDITKWNPIAPNGFFLIDINFSEDDAYAIFARNKHVSEVA